MQTAKNKLGNGWIFLWLALILFCVYSNSFTGIWFGDDKTQILQNQAIQMETLGIEGLARAANTDGNPGLSGPLPNMTFAINYYYSKGRVDGYHFTNYLLHLLTAYFLFLTIKLLWRTPALRGRVTSANQIRLISFVSVLLWALHPINVDSVTYVVQRTTILAAMFSILGIYGFVYAKITEAKAAKVRGTILCIAGFGCAMLSKENAAIFPLFLVLTFGIFFMGSETERKYKLWFWVISGFWVLLSLTIAMLFLAGPGKAIYAELYFSPWERFLTETQVLFFYLYQIFWPMPSHFQVEHYLPLATSLVNPITTLVAVGGIIVLLGAALKFVRRLPWVSFAILFFFIGHAVESTILPLPLISEHRNYLPSMFLGVPFVSGSVLLWNRFGGRAEVRRMIMGIGILVLVLLGFSTYLRHFVWQDETLLYDSAIDRNPKISRTYADLGFYWSQFDDAESHKATIWYFEKSFEREKFFRPADVVRVDFALGEAYLKAKEYDKAIDITKINITKYADDFSNWLKARRFLGYIYLEKEDFKTAHAQFAQLKQEYPDNPEISFDYGNILFQQGEYDDALIYLKQTYEALPPVSATWTVKDTDTLYYDLGMIYSAAEDYATAEIYWRQLWETSKSEAKLIAAMCLLAQAQDLENEKRTEYLTYLKNSQIYEIILAKFMVICDNNRIKPEFKNKLAEILNQTLDFVIE